MDPTVISVVALTLSVAAIICAGVGIGFGIRANARYISLEKWVEELISTPDEKPKNPEEAWRGKVL